MKESGDIKQRISLFFHKENKEQQVPESEVPEKPKGVLAKIWDVIRILCLVLYRLRGILMAIPVILVALRLAAYNAEHLPLLVGINLQTTGEFATVAGQITVPAATYVQDPLTGLWSVQPGVAVLTVTGTV